MELKTASKIIDSYDKSLAKGTEPGVLLRKISYLKNSPAVIKFAYFTLIEDMIRENGKLSIEDKKEILEAYKLLNNFVEDSRAVKYSQNYMDWEKNKQKPIRDKKDELFIKQYLAYTHSLGQEGLLREIDDLIIELEDENNRS